MEVPKRRKLSPSSSSSSTQAEILALLPANPSELSPSSSSRTSTQSSAATVAGNDDLLTEILVRLPVNSLARFKSVSTHWRFLMSSDSFSRLHLLNHCRRPPEPLSFILGVRGRSQLLICHPSLKKLARFPIPRNFDFRYYKDVKLVQSCNGLLLVKAETRQWLRTSYYVVNPTTVQSRCITTPELEPVAVCLLFDPLKSPYYRVVAFWKENPDDYRANIDRFSVYDSATHDWKDGGEVPNVGFTLPDGVSCNGRAYFLESMHPSLCYSPDKELRIIPKPPRKSTKRYIVESNGHLHCFHLSFHGNFPYFYVAELIDDEWVKCTMKGMHTIANTTNVELLGMIRAERIEDSMFLVHVPGRIMIYRFDEGCEVVVDYRSDFFYEEGHFQFEFEDAYPFTPNFASV